MTYRDQVRDVAFDQYGYVTTKDASDLGIPAVELRKLAARGALSNIAYGLYRFNEVPPHARDQFAEALLRVGEGAYLTADAVLALHDLAQVNPRRIRVGAPHRTRARLPGFIQIVDFEVPESELTTYEGIRSTTVARALLDCRGIVMRERLREATREAWLKGLLTPAERVRVRRGLAATTKTTV
ncbi:type IV toxin-antitoxin system AbiEi family antitoxin domain-containing protein [soil metagenome]